MTPAQRDAILELLFRAKLEEVEFVARNPNHAKTLEPWLRDARSLLVQLDAPPPPEDVRRPGELTDGA